MGRASSCIVFLALVGVAPACSKGDEADSGAVPDPAVERARDHRPRIVLGHVVTDVGDPVPDAVVHLGYRRVRTNNSGRFTSEVDETWNGEITAVAEGFASASVVVAVDSPVIESLLRVAPPTEQTEGKRRVLVVVDHRWRGVSGCQVRLTSEQSSQPAASLCTESVADGFVWANSKELPPHPWKVEVRANGELSAELKGVMLGDEAFVENVTPIVVNEKRPPQFDVTVILPDFVPSGEIDHVMVGFYDDSGEMCREQSARERRFTVGLRKGSFERVRVESKDDVWVLDDAKLSEDNVLDLGKCAQPKRLVIRSARRDLGFSERIIGINRRIPYGVILNDWGPFRVPETKLGRADDDNQKGRKRLWADVAALDFAFAVPTVDRLPLVRVRDDGEAARLLEVDTFDGKSTVRAHMASEGIGPDEAVVTLARRGGGYIESRRVRRGEVCQWERLVSGTFMMWMERVPERGEKPDVSARHGVLRVVVEPRATRDVNLRPSFLHGGPEAVIRRK